MKAVDLKEIMMKSKRQKAKMAEELAMFFLEKGKVLTETEYYNSNPVPFPRGFLRSVFGSYPRAVNYAHFVCKEAFEEIESNSKPKPEPKAEEPKEDALAALAESKAAEKKDD